MAIYNLLILLKQSVSFVRTTFQAMGPLSFFPLFISFVGSLAFMIVLIKMKNGFKEKLFFLFYIFSVSYYSLVVFLIHSNLILSYPHFFKSASPFLYCLSIAYYLYFKSHTRPKSSLKNSELLLILIPIIHFIELLPFYLLKASEKKSYILNLASGRDQIIYSHEGWIPTYIHYYLQIILGLFLFFAVLIQIFKTTNQTKSDPILKWFKWSSLIQILSFAALLVLLIIDSPRIIIYNYAVGIFSLFQLIIIVNLFLQPRLLYGTDISNNFKKFNISKSDSSLSDEDIQFYFLKIEDFFDQENSFLNSSFRQHDLAESLNISKNKLSFIINSVYDINFNQLLNKKRIEVVLKSFKEQDILEKYSLSAFSQEVGFKSRTTFIKAFKKKTGMTPSKYINSLR